MRAGRGILRDQIEIGAARRDHHRQAEIPRHPRRGHAIGIEIMRIDQIDALAPRQQRADGLASWRDKENAGASVHPDLGNDQIAGMSDGDAVDGLLRGNRRADARPRHKARPAAPSRAGAITWAVTWPVSSSFFSRVLTNTPWDGRALLGNRVVAVTMESGRSAAERAIKNPNLRKPGQTFARRALTSGGNQPLTIISY